MKNSFLFVSLFIFSIAWAQEENMINEVFIVAKQPDIYKILRKASRAFKKHLSYSKVYCVDFQVTNTQGEKWVDFTTTKPLDSIHHRLISPTVFKHPVFEAAKKINHYEIKSVLFSKFHFPLLDRRYFIVDFDDFFSVSIISSRDTYIIHFKADNIAGSLVVNKSNFYPIHYKRKVIRPYDRGISSINSSNKLLKDITWKVKKSIFDVQFKTMSNGEILIEKWSEEREIENYIYRSYDKKKSIIADPFGFTSTFSMQYVP